MIGAKLAAALLSAQKNMSDAKKDSKNLFFRSSYADLNAIREVTIPALNAAGISVAQPTRVLDNGTAVVDTTLIHESGESFSSQFPIVVVKDNDPQAFGSAVSYARRYALQSLLCVGATDDDGEGAMGRKTNTPVAAAAPSSAASAPAKAPAKKLSFNKNATAPATVDSGDDL